MFRTKLAGPPDKDRVRKLSGKARLVHKIRPANQIWPGKALNLAREAENFAYDALFNLIRSSFVFVKLIKFGP